MANKPAGYQITPEDVARCGHIVVLLRNEMTKREWSPPDLAKALGLRQGSTSIYPWIKGTSAPSIKMRVKLGALFKVPPETFEARDPGEHLPVHAPGTFGPVGKMLGEIQRPTVAPAMRIHEVLSFTINNDGTARIKLDASLPVATATPLLRILLDSGFGGATTE